MCSSDLKLNIWGWAKSSIDKMSKQRVKSTLDYLQLHSRHVAARVEGHHKVLEALAWR